MGKDYFLRELEYLLMDLPEEERQEALQYYRDYFEEAGPQQEESIVAQLGSPAKVAAELKGSLSGTDEEGEFSERGYRNEWYVEDNRVPDQYTEIVQRNHYSGESGSAKYEDTEKQNRRTGKHDGKSFGNRSEDEISKRRNGVLLLLLFLFIGFPMAGTILSAGFSVVTAVAAALFGGFAGLFGLIAGAIGLVIGLFTAGITMIIVGCANMSLPAAGVMVIGWGFLTLAAAFLLMIVVKWACIEVVPSMFRFCIELLKKGIRCVRGIVCRLIGRGGAAE